MLPKGWVQCSIGDVVGIQNGYAFKSKDFTTEGVPLVKQTNLIGDTVNLSKCQYLDKRFLKDKSNFIINKDEILIGMSGSLGKVAIYKYKSPALQNQRTGKLVFYSDSLLSQSLFLHYFTNISYILEKSGKGCGVQNISATEIENLEFILPPLNEQKRIVAKLNAIIPRIDSLKTRLDKIPTLIKRFRQSVLTAAVTGKLTEKWRADHQEIDSLDDSLSILPKKLNDSYLNVFEESQYSDLPATWIHAPLVNVGRIQGGGTPSKSNDSFWEGNIPWISPKDMKVDKISRGRDFISEEAVKNSSTKLIPKNSILFVVRGMILMHTFPVALTQNEVTINQDMKGITPINQTNPEYLFLVLKKMQNKVLSYIKEATHGTLRLEMPLIQTIAVPLPPLEEQKEIVRQVDNLFALADKLETHFQNAKARVDKLSQSVLAKAFRGELVPQDPNDEPAEKLLERIMAQKAKMEKALKGAKKKGDVKKQKPGAGNEKKENSPCTQ